MKKHLLFVLLAAPLSAYAQGAAPLRIGAAGGVSGLVKATAQGASEERVIKSGSPLYLNDRVVTDARGRLQLMLLDETVFTVGPNSDMTLDEFVYDPSNDAGKVSVKMAKGAFRFVTGKVARKEPANMKVKLSVGTIGIRGTIAGGMTGEQGSTVILLGPGAGNNANEAAGAIVVDNGNSSVLIDQPGFGVTLTGGEQTLSVSDMSQHAAQLTSELSSPAPAQGEGQQQSEGGQPAASTGQQGQGPGETSAEGHSAGDEAGQTTAGAGETLNLTQDLDDVTETLESNSNQAVNDLEEETPTGTLAFPTGLSTWDQVRSIETGAMRYLAFAPGAITLSALSGSANTGPLDINFTLEVDFGARTYGGGSSNITLGDMYAYTTILPKTFADLTGDAVITLSTDLQNLENPAFEGSQIKLNNEYNIPAEDVTLDVHCSTFDTMFQETLTGSASVTSESGVPFTPVR